jgi:BirA family biotin operon repressor/biotin-[acetyl-CoA-carboxylase] ligase
MFEVRRFAELDSTNRYLLDEARAGAGAGLVVVADHQTAGRGRLGRRWEAPAGANLLASILLRPALAVEQLHLCTVVVALAARAACGRAATVEPDLKWPNDLMVGERKMAGILAETVEYRLRPGVRSGSASGGGSGRAVVVGIGVNLAWPPPPGAEAAVAVPDELGAATSLWRESGTRVAPGDLLDLLLGELEPRLGEMGDVEGRRRLATAYRRACATLGRRVTVTLPGETVTGEVVDITVEGHLLVDVGAGIRTITAGDVVHLRS